jgi:hypothetical protein
MKTIHRRDERAVDGGKIAALRYLDGPCMYVAEFTWELECTLFVAVCIILVLLVLFLARQDRSCNL